MIYFIQSKQFKIYSKYFLQYSKRNIMKILINYISESKTLLKYYCSNKNKKQKEDAISYSYGIESSAYTDLCID